MAKIKTSELTDAPLDWAVAKCQGYVEQGVYGTPEFRDSEVYLCYCDAVLNSCYAPSTDWAQGGTLIDSMVREGLRLTGYKSLPTDPTSCQAQIGNIVTGGPTPLIAAMRCFCCSKLGDTVEVPDELF